MNHHNYLKQLTQLVGIVLIITLSACVPGSMSTTDEPTKTELTTEAPVVTETREYTATTSVPTALLLYTDEADPLVLSQIQSVLTTLTEQSGLALVTSDKFLTEMLTPNVSVVVGVGSEVDLSSLSSSTPNIRFVAVDDPDIVPTDNLFVIGDPAVRQQRQAFMAGYLGAVISSDYKVGALFSSEASMDVVNAFVIGSEYFCGICKPNYPPYNDFPTWDYLSPSDSESGFETIVDGFVNYGVQILYLQGELISPALLSYLEEFGILVVSDSSPDRPHSNWVGTVQPDFSAALENIWDDVLSESSSVRIPASITLTDIEAGWVSEGRLHLFYNMSAELDAGLVSTEYVP